MPDNTNELERLRGEIAELRVENAQLQEELERAEKRYALIEDFLLDFSGKLNALGEGFESIPNFRVLILGIKEYRENRSKGPKSGGKATQKKATRLNAFAIQAWEETGKGEDYQQAWELFPTLCKEQGLKPWKTRHYFDEAIDQHRKTPS